MIQIRLQTGSFEDFLTLKEQMNQLYSWLASATYDGLDLSSMHHIEISLAPGVSQSGRMLLECQIINESHTYDDIEDWISAIRKAREHLISESELPKNIKVILSRPIIITVVEYFGRQTIAREIEIKGA